MENSILIEALKLAMDYVNPLTGHPDDIAFFIQTFASVGIEMKTVNRSWEFKDLSDQKGD